MNVIALHQTIKKAAGWKIPKVLVANRHKTNQCSFYCSMLRPNNACRKHLILSFYQRKKNLRYGGNGYLQKICRSCKITGKLRAPCPK